MEMALNMGAFEALDEREMFVVDGGGPITDIAIGVGLVVAVPIVAVFSPLAAVGFAFILFGKVLTNMEDTLGNMPNGAWDHLYY